jgi:hypothetical protein
MLTRQVLYNEGGGSNGFSMYVEGGKVYCLAWEGGSGGVWNAQMRQLLQVNGITLLLF